MPQARLTSRGSRASGNDDEEVSAALLRDMATRCLCFRSRRTARLITRDFDAALAPTGLKATQLTLLCAVALRPDLGMTELAELLGLEQSTLSRNIALLRDRGLVRKQPAADKRQRHLALTKKGRTLAAKAYPLWQGAQLEAESRYFAGATRALFEELDENLGLQRS